MDVPASRAIERMSRGERFKFQTAFAMAHDTRLYLLDEVTAGMDPVFRIDYFKILHELIEEECASVVMTSHIEDEISRHMDYIGILEDGRLISFGEVE
jgi:ABC-2 type transport system ATP-binding protein